MLQIIPRLLSDTKALPPVCKDRKETGVTSVLEQDLPAPFHPLHLQLLETLHWECHCLGRREEIGGTNPSP